MGWFKLKSLTIPLFVDSAGNKDKLAMVAIADGFMTHEPSIWREVCRLAARWHNAKGKSKYCFRRTLLKTGGDSKAPCSNALMILIRGIWRQSQQDKIIGKMFVYPVRNVRCNSLILG